VTTPNSSSATKRKGRSSSKTMRHDEEDEAETVMNLFERAGLLEVDEPFVVDEWM